MNTELVNQAVALFVETNQAVALFVETVPLESISVNHPEFHHLYSQECKLYGLMMCMSEGELDEYRRQVEDIDPEI